MIQYITQISQLFTEKTGSLVVPNYYHAARIAQATSPSVIYNDGKTFAFGNEIRENNHAGLIFEYDGVNDPIWIKVGTGADIQDQSNHTRLVGMVGSDNHIYCFRTNPHESAVVIFKSVSPNTIKDGFVEHHRTNLGNVSYPNLFKTANGRINLFMRSSTALAARFSLALILASNDNLNNYSEKVLTSCPGDRRHYPQIITNYGNCTKRVFCLNNRLRSSDVYLANQLLFTDNDDTFNVFHNFDSTFSKDINANGVLTQAELDNFTINGDANNSSLNIGYAIGCNIQDEVFIIDSAFTGLTKVSPNGVIRQGLPAVGIGRAFNLYSNRTFDKLVIQSQNDTTLLVEFWQCNLDLTNFEKILTLDFSYDDYNYNIPANYDEIPLNIPYMIAGGGSGPSQVNIFKYLLTNRNY